MTSERGHQIGRGLRVAALLASLGLALWWLWTRPSAEPSRFDEALDHALGPVMEQREVQQKLRAATSTQARLLARELAQRSIQYLSPRDLELWQTTRVRVAKASPQNCARLWKGGDESFVGPAIALLGDDVLEPYVDMLARALALRLERRPPPSSSAGALDRGLLAIAEQLPADARDAFRTDTKLPQVSDARACELFLMLGNGAEKLEPALRVDFYRALAEALEVRP